MKYGKIIFILILSVCLSGCQGSKQAGKSMEQKEPIPRQSHRTLSSNWETQTDISNLPGIITSISSELGIDFEQQDVEAGRCSYTGISPAGIEIKIEAISLVKNRSVMIVSVRGKQEDFSIMKPLLQIISNALRKAIRNQN